MFIYFDITSPPPPILRPFALSQETLHNLNRTKFSDWLPSPAEAQRGEGSVADPDNFAPDPGFKIPDPNPA